MCLTCFTCIRIKYQDESIRTGRRYFSSLSYTVVLHLATYVLLPISWLQLHNNLFNGHDNNSLSTGGFEFIYFFPKVTLLYGRMDGYPTFLGKRHHRWTFYAGEQVYYYLKIFSFHIKYNVFSFLCLQNGLNSLH